MVDDSTESPFDLDEMMEKVRQEVLKRRAANRFTSNYAVSSPGSDQPGGRSTRIASALLRASQSAEMSTTLPDLSRLPKPKRLLVAQFGRLVMTQISHLRERQTEFNRSVSDALIALAEIKTELDLVQSQVHRLERSQKDLEKRMDSLRGGGVEGVMEAGSAPQEQSQA